MICRQTFLGYSLTVPNAIFISYFSIHHPRSYILVHRSYFIVHTSFLLIKHIFFDNDGTLVDSEIIAVRATLRLLAPYGFQMSEREYAQRYPGLLEKDILAAINAEYGITVNDDYFDELRKAHAQGFDDELRVIPGMDDIFRGVKVPKSIVSNASRRHVEYCLQRLNLYDDLDGQIFSAEQVGRPKPHPDVYLLALSTLQLDPEEVLVVEDSPTGVQAAHAAGLQVIGLLAAAHIHPGHDTRLIEAGAKFLATEANQLEKIFQQFKIM